MSKKREIHDASTAPIPLSPEMRERERRYHLFPRNARFSDAYATPRPPPLPPPTTDDDDA